MMERKLCECISQTDATKIVTWPRVPSPLGKGRQQGWEPKTDSKLEMNPKCQELGTHSKKSEFRFCLLVPKHDDPLLLQTKATYL